MTQPVSHVRTRRPLAVIVLGIALLVAGLLAPPAAAKPTAPQPAGPGLGSRVTVFDPSMPLSEIQAALDASRA